MKRAGSEHLLVYVPGNTLLHRLDARAKLIGLILLAASILSSAPAGLIAISGPILIGLFLAKLPPSRVFGKKGIYLLFVLIIAASTLTGDTPKAGFYEGALYATRLFMLLILAQLFIVTTTLKELRLGVARLLRFFPSKWAWTVSSMMALAVSFVPTPLKIGGEVRLAIQARGLESRRKPVRYLRLLAFLIGVRSFMAAEDTSMAFACRGGSSSIRPAARGIGITSYLVIGICVLTTGFSLVL